MVVKLKLGKGQNLSWTEPELAVMQTHYGAGIDKMMMLLPERTRGAIFAQSALMGLSVTHPWQADELQILRQWYPKIGTKVINYLPDRTVPAIKGQVVRMGLRYRKPRQTPMLQWSAEEFQLLEKNLTVPTRQLLSLFPGRTYGAIDAKKGTIRKIRTMAGGHSITLPKLLAD